jgi:hypothetical protein
MLLLIIVSLKGIIGLEIVNSIPGTKSSFKSLRHFSRWTSPQVDKINSPDLEILNSIEGSARSIYNSPCFSWSICDKSSGSIATFTRPIEIPSTLEKFGQTDSLQMVPVFSKTFSRPPMPMIQPGPAS